MQINSRVIQAHPSGPPKASTIYILIPSSHCLEHLWPNPLKKNLNLLSSCSRMVPEGPCVPPPSAHALCKSPQGSACC